MFLSPVTCKICTNLYTNYLSVQLANTVILGSTWSLTWFEINLGTHGFEFACGCALCYTWQYYQRLRLRQLRDSVEVMERRNGKRSDRLASTNRRIQVSTLSLHPLPDACLLLFAVDVGRGEPYLLIYQPLYAADQAIRCYVVPVIGSRSMSH